MSSGGATPFAIDPMNEAATYAAITNHTASKAIFPAALADRLSEEFKEMVNSLLDPLPGMRLQYAGANSADNRDSLLQQPLYKQANAITTEQRAARVSARMQALSSTAPSPSVMQFKDFVDGDYSRLDSF